MSDSLSTNQPTFYSEIRNQNILNECPHLSVTQQKSYNFDTFIQMVYKKNEKYSVLSLDSNYFKRIMLNIKPRNISSVLKQTRVHSGYSLKQLEKLTGFSKTSISHRENSSTSNFPNISTILIYLDSFNMTLAQFLFLVFMHVSITEC